LGARKRLNLQVLLIIRRARVARKGGRELIAIVALRTKIRVEAVTFQAVGYEAPHEKRWVGARVARDASLPATFLGGGRPAHGQQGREDERDDKRFGGHAVADALNEKNEESEKIQIHGDVALARC
jgi:hypothetical protein